MLNGYIIIETQKTEMQILRLPNPILKKVCTQVCFPLSEQVKQNIRQLKIAFRQSFKTHKVRTLGLSAPQIGFDQRIFIMAANMNYGSVRTDMLYLTVKRFEVIINPKIVAYSPKAVKIKEQCLSFDRQTLYEVQRAESIDVEYYTPDNIKVVGKLQGIKARVFLHEYDHLEGITMDVRGKLVEFNEEIKQKDAAALAGEKQQSSELNHIENVQ